MGTDTIFVNSKIVDISTNVVLAAYNFTIALDENIKKMLEIWFLVTHPVIDKKLYDKILMARCNIIMRYYIKPAGYDKRPLLDISMFKCSLLRDFRL